MPPQSAQELQYLAREVVAWCLILLGAFFLAKSVVAKGQKGAMKELLGLRIDKLKVFRDLIIQRLEAAFGFLFVLAGVSIHIYVLLRKYEDRHVQEAYTHVATYLGATIAAMVVLAVLFHFVCKYVSRKSFLEILAYLVVRYRYRIEDDQALLKQIGELLEVERREDDTVETYAARVEERLKVEEVRARLAKQNKPLELD